MELRDTGKASENVEQAPSLQQSYNGTTTRQRLLRENSISSRGSDLLIETAGSAEATVSSSSFDPETIVGAQEADDAGRNEDTLSDFSDADDISFHSASSGKEELSRFADQIIDDLRLTPDAHDGLEAEFAKHSHKRNSVESDRGNPIKYKTNNSSAGMIASPTISSLDVADRLNIDRFTMWCLGFVSLNFDLEIGQDIDFMYPRLVDFTDSEKANIRFSSFPDTSSSVGDTTFSFRFAVSENTKLQLCKYASSARTVFGYGNVDDFQGNSIGDYLYGYVLFRQQKDGTNRRGYLQKSVCMLSILPFPGLFLRLVSIVGPIYLDTLGSTVIGESGSNQNNAKVVLEAAAHAISQWSTPSPGQIVDLPFFGIILQVEMPSDSKIFGSRAQLLQTSHFALNHRRKSLNTSSQKFTLYSNGEQILPTIPCSLIYPRGFFSASPFQQSYAGGGTTISELDLLENMDDNVDLPGTSIGILFRFLDVIDHLWTIWELVLLGESLVVMGKSQASVSEAVWWLSQIIRPIPYSGDFRPYFTIQDADFHKFINMNKKLPEAEMIRASASFYKLGVNISSSAVSATPNRSFSSLPKSISIQPSPSSTTTNLHRIAAGSSSVTNGGGVYVTAKMLSFASMRQRLQQLQQTAVEIDTQNTDHNSVILGVTNPFFGNAMKSWPHILRIDGSPLITYQKEKNSRTISASSSMTSLSSINTHQASNAAKRPWATSSRSNSGMRSSADQPTGLSTSYKSFVKKDKRIINALKKAFEESTNIPSKPTKSGISALFGSSPTQKSEGVDFVANALSNMVPITSPTTSKRYKAYVFNEILRRHFVELTEMFLVPFNRYFGTLLPPPLSFPYSNDNSSQTIMVDGKSMQYHPPPTSSAFSVKPFDPTQFLTQMLLNGQPDFPFVSSAATSKTQWIDMYSKFLESPNFIGWLREKKKISEYQIRNQYLDSVRNGADKFSDLDYFLIIRQELLWCHAPDPVRPDMANMFPSSHDPDSFKTGFLVASLEARRELEIHSKMIWARLPVETKAAFKKGLFDPILQSLPKEEDDFILVA